MLTNVNFRKLRDKGRQNIISTPLKEVSSHVSTLASPSLSNELTILDTYVLAIAAETNLVLSWVNSNELLVDVLRL